MEETNNRHEKMAKQTADGARTAMEELMRLFPNCVTETASGRVIDFEKLKEETGADAIAGKEEERYRFTWPGKRLANAFASEPTDAALRPEKGKSVDFDTTEHLYIEGDNLEALKILRESYLGKIKMIYIDPPYNTGNDFVYKDDFRMSREAYDAVSGEKDEEGNRLVANTASEPRYHTNWLNMIYPRLKVARDLLTDDGVIFISIDDHEVHNLRKVCDEIFGDSNFVTALCWRRRKTQANLSKDFSKVHEYILVYTKSIDKMSLNRVPYSEEYIKKTFTNKDNDPKGPYQTGPLARPANSSNKEYTLTMPNGRQIKAKWSCSQETFDKYVAENRLVIPREGEGMPRIKIYLSELPGMIPNTWLDDTASNDDASRMIESLFGSMAYFDYSKPIELIKYLATIGSDKDSIVLDFFSGSGTTGHAVMALNAEDGGRRRFILVQAPEKTEPESKAYEAGYRTICDIGEERLRRAGERLNVGTHGSCVRGDAPLQLWEQEPTDPSNVGRTSRASLQNSSLDTGFRVLRLDESVYEENAFVTPGQLGGADDLLTDNIRGGVTALDLLFLVMSRYRFPLSAKIEERTALGRSCFRVTADGRKLIADFSPGLSKEFAEEIAKSEKPDCFATRDDSFDKDSMCDNVDQVFRLYSPQTRIIVL